MEGNKNCKIKGRTPSTGQSSLLSLYRIKKVSVVLHYMLQILRMMKVFCHNYVYTDPCMLNQITFLTGKNHKSTL